MKKRHMLPAMLTSFILLTACFSKPLPAKTAETAALEIEETASEQEVFRLSDTEAKAYSDLRSSKDPKVLKGLEPLSIARLYIQTLIDFDPETQYTLYDTESGIDGWSLEEHLDITGKEGRMSRDVIYSVFVPYSSGEVKINGDEAVIVYGTGSGLHIFKLRKTSENIWKVSFLPIQ